MIIADHAMSSKASPITEIIPQLISTSVNDLQQNKDSNQLTNKQSRAAKICLGEFFIRKKKKKNEKNNFTDMNCGHFRS